MTIPFTEAQLRSWFGDTIFSRGQRYFLKGAVLSCVAAIRNDGLTISGVVRGSRPEPSEVTLRHRRGKQRFSVECPCPYGYFCKHGVALGLAYLARGEIAPAPPAEPTWRDRLAAYDALLRPSPQVGLTFSYELKVDKLPPGHPSASV